MREVGSSEIDRILVLNNPFYCRFVNVLFHYSLVRFIMSIYINRLLKISQNLFLSQFIVTLVSMDQDVSYDDSVLDYCRRR